MPIQITCNVCGKVVFRPPSEFRRKYCSAECYGISQRGRNICSIAGCDKVVKGRGFCNAHYLKAIRFGNPCFSKPRGVRKDKGVHRNAPKKCLNCNQEFYPKLKSSKFCSSQCYGKYKAKPYIVKKGYKKILYPSHARADQKGYVFEHILIAEQILNRPLKYEEECHHKDGDRMNNNPENIIICANHSVHMKYH